MSLITGENTPSFAKDTVYIFLNMTQINMELSKKKINQLVDTFMNAIPAVLKLHLQA